MAPRPRFATQLESFDLRLPAGKKVGSALATALAPNGDIFLLHQPYLPTVEAAQRTTEGWLGDVVHLTAQGECINAWGGPDHIPNVDGISQWPEGREGLECDRDGNIWVFGYWPGDDAMLKFSPDGKLLLRIGQRGKPGNDDDTQLLGRPTSCYHNTETREVFVSDGYGNHRVIAFNADTGAFTRMWGAYGKKPSSLSADEGFANPVHKVAVGPGGLLYVCDRIKNRVQEFELIPGGARFLREVTIAPGTGIYGAAYDVAFTADGKFMIVSDGSNSRIWTVDRESFAVLGWTSVDHDVEGEVNTPRAYGALPHRFTLLSNGDLLLACVGRGLQRLRFLGVK